MCDYKGRKTNGQIETHTDRRTDAQAAAGQSYPYVPLCFACDTKTEGRECQKATGWEFYKETGTFRKRQGGNFIKRQGLSERGKAEI